MYVAADGLRRLAAAAAAVAVLAADVRGLLDESPDLARIRLDILGSHKSMPLLQIGKRRMQVCHYHIVASDAYNGYMPQHFVLVCWVSRSTSLRQFFAGLYNKRRTRGALSYRRMFDIQVLVLPSIGKKPKAMERGSNVLHRHTPREFGYAETFQITEQGWGGAITFFTSHNVDLTGEIISFHQSLLTDTNGAADIHPGPRVPHRRQWRYMVLEKREMYVDLCSSDVSTNEFQTFCSIHPMSRCTIEIVQKWEYVLCITHRPCGFARSQGSRVSQHIMDLVEKLLGQLFI